MIRFIVRSVRCGFLIFHILVQFINNRHCRCAVFIVPIVDLVGNAVPYIHKAKYSCTCVRCCLLLLRHRVLHWLQRERIVIPYLYCCPFVDHAANVFAFCRYCRSRQHDYGQSYFAFRIRFYIFYRPCDCVIRFIVRSVRCGCLVFHILVQFINNRYCRCTVFIVPIIDLVGNAVTYIHKPKYSCTCVRCCLLFLRHRVLHRLQRDRIVIPDLYRCSFVDHAANIFTCCRHRRSGQHFYGQLYFAFCIRCYVSYRPRDCVICFIICSIRCGFLVFHVLIQRINDCYCRRAVFIVPIVDLVGNGISYIYKAKYTSACIRICLLLLRHRIFHSI